MKTKKLILPGAILIALLVAVASFAVAPSYNATNGTYYTQVDTSWTIADTVTATDSMTILSGWEPEAGWEYILVRNDITGGGSDSVKLRVVVDAYDKSTHFHRVDIDSLTAAAGEAIKLDVWGQIFGNRLTIKLIGYTGNGGAVIVNKFKIWKRKIVNETRAWR